MKHTPPPIRDFLLPHEDELFRALSGNVQTVALATLDRLHGATVPLATETALKIVPGVPLWRQMPIEELRQHVYYRPEEPYLFWGPVTKMAGDPAITRKPGEVREYALDKSKPPAITFKTRLGVAQTDFHILLAYLRDGVLCPDHVVHHVDGNNHNWVCPNLVQIPRSLNSFLQRASLKPESFPQCTHLHVALRRAARLKISAPILETAKIRDPHSVIGMLPQSCGDTTIRWSYTKPAGKTHLICCTIPAKHITFRDAWALALEVYAVLGYNNLGVYQDRVKLMPQRPCPDVPIRPEIWLPDPVALAA